jgi:hypothetical protein
MLNLDDETPPEQMQTLSSLPEESTESDSGSGLTKQDKYMMLKKLYDRMKELQEAVKQTKVRIRELEEVLRSEPDT